MVGGAHDDAVGIGQFGIGERMTLPSSLKTALHIAGHNIAEQDQPTQVEGKATYRWQ